MAIKNLEVLEKYLELEDGQKLSDILKSEEEVELKVIEGKFFSTEEDSERIGNYKTEFETAGREKLLKEMRDESELQYDGVKDPKKFVEALTTKVKTNTLEEAKIEPDKKILSLETDISALRTQLETKDTAFNQLNTDMAAKENNLKIEKSISSHLKDNTSLSKDDQVLLFKSKHDVRIGEDGKISVYKNGEVLKDEMRNPVGLDKLVSEFSAGFITKPAGGGGGGDDVPPGGAGSISAFMKEMNDKNVASGSEAFNKEMDKRLADGSLKL